MKSGAFIFVLENHICLYVACFRRLYRLVIEMIVEGSIAQPAHLDAWVENVLKCSERTEELGTIRREVYA